MRPRTFKIFTLACVLALLLPTLSQADYRDVVVLENGNEIFGTIKSLSQGQLLLDTDAMGTVTIKWDKIVEIRTAETMEIKTDTGARLFGTLDPPDGPAKVKITADSSTQSLGIDELVQITPIGESFLNRLQGSVSAGFSFTKSSDVAQFSFSGNLLYEDRSNQWALTYNNIVTNQDSGTTQQLYSRLGYRYQPEGRWYGLGFFSFQRNQELGIDARGVLGAGAGRTLFQSSQGQLSVNGGLDLNVEDSGTEQDSSLEAFAAIEYSLFKYSGLQSNLVMSAVAFPNLSESGRFRWQVDATWRQQIFNNMFWDWSLYASGDNDPPASANSESDYGIVTSLGWSFGR